MTQTEKSRQTALKVANCVDNIYNNTMSPMRRSMREFGGIGRVVGTLLAKRGIIVNNGTRHSPEWVWNSDMRPTDNLRREIINDYRQQRASDSRKHNAKRKAAAEKAEKEAPTSTDGAAIKPVEVRLKPEYLGFRKATIKDYSAQELWDELKSRGFEIKEGRLCRQTYLD